jgi:hypothetical protein
VYCPAAFCQQQVFNNNLKSFCLNLQSVPKLPM